MPATIIGLISIVGSGLVILGVIAIGAGIFIMLSSVFSKNVREIQKRAAQLTKKGVLEDISGALGNASFLIKELNEMIKTDQGVGTTLVVIGICLIAGSLLLLNHFLH